MIALTRDPSGRRASTIGLASSTRRPSGDRMRSMTCSRCAESANRAGAGSMRPHRSTNTASGPLTMTSVTSGSRRSGSSGPNPSVSSTTACTTARRSAAGMTRRSCIDELLDELPERAGVHAAGLERGLTDRACAQVRHQPGVDRPVRAHPARTARTSTSIAGVSERRRRPGHRPAPRSSASRSNLPSSVATGYPTARENARVLR